MSLDLPNYTFWIQLMLFFGAFLALNYLVFTPLLKVIEERRKKTIETFKKTEELSQKTASLSHEYDGKLKEHRSHLKQKIEGARQEFLKNQAQILEKNREDFSQGMKRHQVGIGQQVVLAEKELTQDIENASLEIAHKFGA